MKAALDVVTTAPEFDLILVVVGSSARFHPQLAVRPIIDSAASRKPLAAFLVPDAPDALARLKAAGVPSFYTPEACADAIVAALKRRAPKRRVVRRGVDARGHGRLLDELEAFALLDRLGVTRAPAMALDATISRIPALPFPLPVAVKILAADIAHKSDIGGVTLGVSDGDALLDAIRRMRREVGERAPGTFVDRVLVQPMISGLGEALVGYRVDPDVGPLIMLAAGGTMTEVYRDRSLRLAPVDLAQAREMIEEVRAMRPLAGFRGRPEGDLEALAQAVVALSALATMAEPAVIEAEINPLIVRRIGEGVVAVDALVRVA
jgi:acyl-CoA synthetase (NDP forming)